MSSAEIMGCLWVGLAVMAIAAIYCYLRKRLYKELYLSEASSNRMLHMNLIVQNHLIKDLKAELAKQIDDAQALLDVKDTQIIELRRNLSSTNNAGLTEKELKHMRLAQEKLKEDVAELKLELRAWLEKYNKLFNDYEWYRTMVRIGFPEIFAELDMKKRMQMSMNSEQLKMKKEELKENQQVPPSSEGRLRKEEQQGPPSSEGRQEVMN